MQLALLNNQLGEAEPGLKGLCPQCKNDVLAKCGEIKIWHWAHINLQECDPWWEPETLWHRNWKNNFPQDCREVIIKHGDKTHRADIKIDKTVIELQTKPLSPEELREREYFYWSAGYNLIWIYKFPDLNNIKIIETEYGFSFKWKYMPRSLAYHQYEKFLLDAGHPEYPDMLLKINRFYQNKKRPWGGYGAFVSKKKFIQKWSDTRNSRLFAL